MSFYEAISIASFQHSNIPLLLSYALLPLPHEFLKGTIRIDAETGVLGHFPVFLIFQKGGVERPEPAWAGLHRVDEAKPCLVEENTITVPAAFDIGSAVSCFAVPFQDERRCGAEEGCDVLDIVIVDESAAFAVTAVSTSFAFECLHRDKCLKCLKCAKVPIVPETDINRRQEQT